MTYSNRFRKNIWNRFEECQDKLQNLKSFVQDSVPITKEELDKFLVDKDNLLKELNNISLELQNEYENKFIKE